MIQLFVNDKCDNAVKMELQPTLIKMAKFLKSFLSIKKKNYFEPHIRILNP